MLISMKMGCVFVLHHDLDEIVLKIGLLYNSMVAEL